MSDIPETAKHSADVPLAQEAVSQVAVIMGSQSDWPTMQHASATLKDFDVTHEVAIVSAHRTPQWMTRFATEAEERGIQVIIAGAGGAAHLPGMVAAQTLVPVLGVPMESKALQGMDSLLSIVQMPRGVPVGAMAIGKAGAINAALMAVAILGNQTPAYREALRQYRQQRAETVLQQSVGELALDPLAPAGVSVS